MKKSCSIEKDSSIEGAEANSTKVNEIQMAYAVESSQTRQNDARDGFQRIISYRREVFSSIRTASVATTTTNLYKYRLAENRVIN